MKKLSDYKGEDAIELWSDLLDSLTEIMTDKNIMDSVRAKKPRLIIAKEMLKSHKKEVEQILLRIDPAPLTGLNIITRLVSILAELGEDEELKSFFEFAEQEKTESESSGFVMVNTEVKEN